MWFCTAVVCETHTTPSVLCCRALLSVQQGLTIQSSAGNSGFSWSDVLLGDLPNVYVYAANNPSESIIAKRRGYGTIVSHNVPPYGRQAPWPHPEPAHGMLAPACGLSSCASVLLYDTSVCWVRHVPGTEACWQTCIFHIVLCSSSIGVLRG